MRKEKVIFKNLLTNELAKPLYKQLKKSTGSD